MEIPRDTAAYGGRMWQESSFIPGEEECVRGAGRAAERGAAACCVCVLAEGRLILPTLVTLRNVADHR